MINKQDINHIDIVDKKGTNSLVLLYGQQRTGKTLTVEELSRLFRRTLYSVSFEELGLSVAELE